MKLTTFKFGNNAVLRTSLIAFSSLALLTACGGGGGGSSNDSQVTDTTGNGGNGGNGGTGGTGNSGDGGNGGGSTTFNINGTLSGLAANTEIVLVAKNNGVEKTLTLNSNSSFAFADQFNGNTDLVITKIDNPAFKTVDNAAANVQVCNLSNGKREIAIANSNAATVNISCAVKMIYPVSFNKNDSIRKLFVTSSTAVRGNNNSNGTISVFETNTANSKQIYNKVFAANGKAFFIENVISGFPLYSNLHETDGTVAGTKLVSSYAADIKILNNTVFYTVTTDTEQGLLKTYDGINPSTPVESFKKTAFLETNIENTLAFTAEYPVSGGSPLSGLWLYDGNEFTLYDLGTIHDVNPFIFKVGDRYYFKGNDSGASKLLYTSELNSRKVATLTEIKANLSDLSVLNTPAAGVNIASTEIEILGTPIIYKNDLYISGVEKRSTPPQYRIWKNTETTQFPGIKLGSGQANINAKNLTVFNDKLYFRGHPQTLSDYGIWEYDGTTTTEVLNKGDINGSEYHSLIEFNNKLHVFASKKSDNITDNNIFSIDASSSVKDVGYAHKAFRAHGIYNNHLIYSAIDTDDSGEEFFEVRAIEASSEPYAFNSLYFESLAQ